jgi:hypothetical protein
MGWDDALYTIVGRPKPEDTLELRNSFVESCLLDKNGNPITQHELHLTMQEFVFRMHNKGERRMILLCPYNSGKSQQFPIALLVYLSTMNPELEHLIISADPKLASKRITAIRDMVESQEYRYWCKINDVDALKYSHKDTGSSDKIVFDSFNRTGNPSVEAYGVLTGGAGQRASYLWLDDICSDKDRKESAHRENVLKRTNNVWIKRLHDDGKTIGVATPYHEDDANMTFCKDGTFNVLKIAVSNDLDKYIVNEYLVD